MNYVADEKSLEELLNQDLCEYGESSSSIKKITLLMMQQFIIGCNVVLVQLHAPENYKMSVDTTSAGYGAFDSCWNFTRRDLSDLSKPTFVLELEDDI